VASALLLLCFAFVFLTCLAASTDSDLRTVFLSASVIWGLIVAAITETLSALQFLTPSGAVGSWAIANLISASSFFIAARSGKLNIRLPAISRTPASEILLVLGVAGLMVATAVAALVAPPNTYDSMTYHMARIVHWIQNRSVADYPTAILRQLYSNPWAEFAVAQLQLLSGTDRLANLVEWFSMVGCILGTTLIVKELGGNARGQLLTAVVTVTIPIGILQGSSTQNDYVLALWMVCVVYWLLIAKRSTETNLGACRMLGASVGLAILTKATAYVFALPLLVWFMLGRARTERAKALKSIALIALTVLAINSGHYLRNLDLFRSPLGPFADNGGQAKYTNSGVAITTIVSNIVRNASLHLDVPISTVNVTVEAGIRSLLRRIGIDADDPRTTWNGFQSHIPMEWTGETYAGNPLHFFLMSFAK
jgi:hypothetical protein